MNLAIRYGGRAGGAFLAYHFVGRRFGTVGAVATAALGWLAAGYLVDMVAPE